MDKKVIIIGKSSNLSTFLKKSINNATLLPTTEIGELNNILIKNKLSTIIYNTFCKSTLINKNIDPSLFSYYSFENLSQFIKICLKNEIKVEKIIYTSSSSLYGNNKFSEEDSHWDILSLYASFKLTSELLLKKYIIPSKIKLIITRVFNMYGGDDHFSIVSKIGNAIKNNQILQINNYGNSIRDFICIDDVVAIYKLLIAANFYGIINVSSGKGYSIKSIVQIAEEIFQKKLNFRNKIIDEIEVSIGSNKKLKQILNYSEFSDISQYYKKQIN